MDIETPLSAIKTLLRMQAFVVVLATTTALGINGWKDAYSALFGGLIGFLPNALFAYRVLHAKSAEAKDVLRAFYVGESWKIVVTAALFVIVFQIPGISVLPLFCGFIAVIMVFWLSLLLMR